MSSRQIFSNVGALAAARGVTAILAFITTVYLARVLQPSAFGMLTWALAYFAYFRLIPEMGLGLYAVREIARTPHRVGHFVNHLLALRLLLALGALGLFMVVLLILDLPPLFRAVVAVQAIGIFGIALSLEWVYQGVERMGILAIRNVIVGVLGLIGVLLFVHSPGQVVVASLILAGALLAGSLWLLLTYQRDFGSVRVKADVLTWRSMLKPSLPIAISVGLVAINVHLDHLMLGLMRPTDEVGLYGAAYRILLAIGIPAQILLQAFMPSLSNSYGDSDAMYHRARLFSRWLFLIGLPAAGAGILLASDLVGVFGPQYSAAIPALTILMVHGAFQYVHMAYGNPLIAWNRQTWYMWAIAGAAAMNVIANIILIPRFGIEGAATATLASEVVAVAALIVLHRRMSPSLYSGEFGRALVVTAFAIGAGVVLRLLFNTGFVVTASAIGVSYVAALLLFRIVIPGQLIRVFRPV